jgi:hypothetical protein
MSVAPPRPFFATHSMTVGGAKITRGQTVPNIRSHNRVVSFVCPPIRSRRPNRGVGRQAKRVARLLHTGPVFETHNRGLGAKAVLAELFSPLLFALLAHVVDWTDAALATATALTLVLACLYA